MKLIVISLIALVILTSGCVAAEDRPDIRRVDMMSTGGADITAFCDDSVVCFGIYNRGGTCFRDSDLVYKYCEEKV